MLRGLAYCLVIVIMGIVGLGEAAVYWGLIFFLGYSTTVILKKIDELQYCIEEKNNTGNENQLNSAQNAESNLDIQAEKSE